MRSSTHTLSRSLPIALAALALTTAQAGAQTTFSIDAKGPTFLAPSCGFGAPIFPDDILGVCHPSTNPAPGVLPAPRVVIPAGPGGLGLAPLGTFYDVDALSYAADGPALPGMPRGSVWFSLRRESTALPTPFPPSAATELGIAEGAADLFIDVGLLPGPLPPALGGNTLAVDANGVPSPGLLGYPSLGLIEPHGVCLPGFDPGDNIDALDIANTPVPALGPVLFSIGNLAPCAGFGALGGLRPGAILGASGGLGGPFVWAPPGLLGLDLAGAVTDDLDALAVFENGVAGFQPSPGPYAWAPFAPFDMVLFSVSNGSAVIGAPDSVFGIPIQAGDILIPPVPGGLSPFPGIFIAAENLGLVTGRFFPVVGDDIDGLDVLRQPLSDCNSNGQEDALDIAIGLEQDCNGNGIPDRCEFTQSTYCPTGTTSNGCNPSISGTGVPSASLSCAYQIDVSNVDGQRAGILFYGVNGPIASPWACGGSMLCVKAPTQRTGGQTSGGTLNNCDGTLTLDFNNYMATHPLAIGQPLFAGENFYFQGWFRDPPCGKATTHLSDALRFSLAP